VDLGTIGSAFRAQLIVPEQRQLFDYWLEQAKGRIMPARADISPARIPRLLAGISLVEICADSARCRFRLAGTRLREIYDREITGLHLEDLDWGDKQDYWHAAYNRAIAEAKPAQGVLRGPVVHKEHLIQYWLKLPLSSDGTVVDMLLCHDHFMPASEAAPMLLAASS
jgi:hypothetical protein